MTQRSLGGGGRGGASGKGPLVHLSPHMFVSFHCNPNSFANDIVLFTLLLSHTTMWYQMNPNASLFLPLLEMMGQTQGAVRGDWKITRQDPCETRGLKSPQGKISINVSLSFHHSKLDSNRAW